MYSSYNVEKSLAHTWNGINLNNISAYFLSQSVLRTVSEAKDGIKYFWIFPSSVHKRLYSPHISCFFPLQFFHIHPPASGSCYTRPDQTLIKSRNLWLAASSNKYWGKVHAQGSCTVSENPDPKAVQLHIIPLERYISSVNSLLPF